jgi:hypothetical protein
MPAELVPRQPPPLTAAARKDRKTMLRMLLGGALVGFLLAAAGIRVGKWFAGNAGAAAAAGDAPDGLGAVALLVALPFAWLLAVAWHELGHVVAGRLVGGQFLLFIVGPFKWQRTPEGIRFSWNRSVNLGGGLSACLPLDDRDLPRRFAVMIAGGPLSSVLLTVLAGGLAAVLDTAPWRGIAMLVAVMSGIIALTTLIPTEAAGFKSDGKRFLGLRRRDAAATQEAALLALSVAPMRGLRPAAFPPAQLAAATALHDGSAHALYGHLYAYQYHADRGELPLAQQSLDKVVDGESAMPGFMREMVRAEYAWLLAIGGGPSMAGPARAWLDSAGPVEMDPATRWRAAAAVLLAEGQVPAAREAIAAGRVALRNNSMAPVPSAFLLETLDELDRRAGSP